MSGAVLIQYVLHPVFLFICIWLFCLAFSYYKSGPNYIYIFLYFCIFQPTQTDTRSYNPYSTRTFRSVDGKQSYISSSGYSSGYLQNSVSYGTTGIHGRGKGVLGSNVPVNPKGFSNPIRSNNSFGSRSSNLPLNTRSRQFIASPNFYKSPIHNPPLRPLDKVCIFDALRASYLMLDILFMATYIPSSKELSDIIVILVIICGNIFVDMLFLS